MSTLKRKDAPGGQPPAKSAKNTKEARPTKKESGGRDVKPTTKPPKPRTEQPKPVVSLLKEEEPMFPRGGGSVLTPLEQKKIQLEAKADALREDEFATEGKKASKKKAVKAAKGKKADKSADTEDSVKVESLSFKKLAKGSLVLGQVSRINNLDIEVSLPNNLTGHISIVAISEQLTQRLQAAADQSENEDEDEDEDKGGDVDLNTLFTIGQYLRVYVVSTMDETAGVKGKRKIELSIRPTEANTGLGKDDIVQNATVMASVVSVEDHGCVMDVGIPGLRAFMPKTEIEAGIDDERLQPGAVHLCSAMKGSNNKVIQLSLLQSRLGNSKTGPIEASTISTYLPGTLAEVLITNTDRRGLSGKILGSLDVTADIIHSGAGPNKTDLDATYKIGTKVKARIICNFPTAKEPKLGVSLLPHLTSLETKRPGKSHSKKLPTEVLPISSFVEKCTVRHVEAEIGLFVDIGIPGLGGFVHISRVKDGKVDALYESSGPYKVDSVHAGRVVGYSEVDGLFQISFEKSILEQEYIRLEDVPIGAVVNCEVEKVVVGEEGVSGLVVKITDSVKGFVPEIHLSDVRLQHPEKKFREGVKVKARVLSVDTGRNRMRLTMKKTLVNSEAPVVKSYDDVTIGMQIPGTIIKMQGNGAHVRFYGTLKGFLPVSEMSEAYIRDPSEHFRLGQVVSLHVLDVDEETNRLVVSCKDPAAFGLEKQNALKKLQLGDFVDATVTQKTEDHIHVELVGSELKAILPVGHLTDKSVSKNQYASKRINVGQTLSDLVVLDKFENRRAITLTQKPSLVAAAKSKTLLSSFDDAKEGAVVAGFVRNVTQTAVFVQFAGNLHALLPKARLPAEAVTKPDFGFHKLQSIEVRIISLIKDLRRILVAPSSDVKEAARTKADKPAPSDDISFGSTVRVKINSIKETQMNVQIVDSPVQGRIDVSQVFDSWDEIDNPKEPLSKFHKQQVLRAKVIGVHDAKDHKFLPFSHRSMHSVLELTVKRSEVKADDYEPLSLDKVKAGSSHIVFVNNVTPQYLWVNLAPTVRGRISAMDASDDVSLLGDLAGNFPPGSALKAKVTAVDVENQRLDLSARSAGAPAAASWASLRKNMVLAGKVTKVNERQILVQLSDTVSGPVHLPDMADDFASVNTLHHKKNDIARVSVVEVDASNKRLRLSMRPSRIMSSTLPVVDKEITDFSQLSTGDVVRGFVKNVADKGLFVLLGGQVTAMVKIANLSDRFLKNWKDEFQVDQLVKGRVLAVDAAARQVELSLKASMVDDNYVPLTQFGDLREGQVVTGRVRKVEDFGAFIQIDNSANLSGLCHRSQMADNPVKDATKLYKEGDLVKAVIMKLEADKKRISFGLKSSLFDDDTDMSDDEGAALGEDDDEDDDDEDGDEDDSDVEMADGGAVLKILGTDNLDSDSDEDEDDDGDEDDDDDDDVEATGLAVGKKSAWSADPFAESDDEPEDEDAPADEKAKRKRKKNEIQVDRTAELDVKGPQTASDYERLLLGQPDSSELWIAYMASQMQVSDLSKAREVAERAIKSINIREETEKLNVWVAYLNLEVAYGSKQTVEAVLERACQYNNAQEIYERLASIYIQSDKLEDADKLFEEKLIKKFGSQTPTVWTNYAHFLHVTKGDPQRARALLPRATQQLGDKHSQGLIGRFAALEFRSPHGEPEHGRTLFAKLLDVFPKKGDLWGQLVDLEIGAAGDDDLDAVRDVFERRTRVRGLKPQQAEKWFRRWAAWEEKRDPKGKQRVMAKAQDWAAAYKGKKDA